MAGKSAQFTNQSRPLAMVRGADQWSPSSTLKRRAWALSAAGSIHDRYDAPVRPHRQVGLAAPRRRAGASSAPQGFADAARSDSAPRRAAARGHQQAQRAASGERRKEVDVMRRFAIQKEWPGIVGPPQSS